MSDILAAFEREQAEEQEREQRLFKLMQQGASGSSADEPATSRAARPASAAAGRNTHRAAATDAAATSSTLQRAGSASSVAAAAAAASSSSAAVAAASSSLDGDAEDAASRFDSDFALRPLLWSCLRSSVPAAEHAELRRLIGNAELERNEALQSEVEALLSIASATQLRNARAKAKQAANADTTAAARGNTHSGNSSLFTRAALPDSATRAFLADEVQSLLLSLRSHALRSGILQPDDTAEGHSTSDHRPASSSSSVVSRGSSAGGNGLGQSGSSGLAKILPRPETARQKRVLDQMVAQALTHTRRDTHSAGHMMPSAQQQASDSAASAPSSRPASGARAPLTARPSSARQRSLSSLSSGGATPPPPADAIGAAASMGDQPAAAAAAAAAVLSHSLLSTSTNSGADSARSNLVVRSLRSVLEEERKALMQDVEYLHACLELEIDETIQVEQQQQQKQLQTKNAKATASAATAASSSSSDCSAPDDADVPASVSELRALEKSLKAALVAEEVRSHTLALMSGVAAAHQADPFAAKSNAVQPLVAPGAGAAAATVGSNNTSGPLKAVRIPSAGRVRPVLNGSPLSPPPVRATSVNALPAAAAAAATPSSPPAGPVYLAELMEMNADLFSAGPMEDAAASSAPSSSSSAPRSSQRPAIPLLALGALGGGSGSSSASSGVVLDHFPAGPGPVPASPPLSPSDRDSPYAAAVSTPIRRTASSSKTASSASESKESVSVTHSSLLSPSASPLTSRSASKARSRIQAAQNFQDNPSAAH